MKTEFWNSIAINGLLLALVSIIVTLAQTLIPAYSILFSIFKLIATVGVLFYFIKQYGMEQDSFTYGNGFKYGFMVSLCSAIVLTFYMFVHHTYIFPDLFETQIDAAMQIAERFNSAGSIDIERLMANLPLYMIFGVFLNAIIYGLIFPAILANFTKKELPPFASPEE